MPDNPNATGSIFDNYDATGALNGLFAPAYIRGYAPSEQAVGNWMANQYSVKPTNIDQTRMPEPWTQPNLTGGMFGHGGLQSGSNIGFGDARGAVDPEALRVMSQGGAYDWEARRAAIAHQIELNNAAQANFNDTGTNRNWLDFLRRQWAAQQM